MAWLGRTPETRASGLYRCLRIVGRFLLFVVFRFRFATGGQEHIPKAGYILVGAVHRGWIDPFLVLHALPLEPRAWFLGSAATAFDKPWKERLLRRLGGMLPVWRGGHGVEQHVESAEAVVRAGGVFVLFPEGGVGGPPDDITAFRVGAAIIALRMGAPIVPMVLVGNQELYVGRRLVTRILPPTTAMGMLNLPPETTLPDPNSREEIALAKSLTEALEDVLAPEVRRRYPETVDPPGRPRRLRGLTWLLLKRSRSGRP